MAEPTTSAYANGAALDSDTTLFGDAVNLIQLTLDADINDSVQTVSVSESITGINTPCYILVNSELIYAVSKAAGDFTSCVRAAGGTTAASHTNGTAVYVTYTANHYNQLKRAIIAIETFLGTTLTNLGSIINAFTGKTTPVGADKIAIGDSAASWASKSVLLSNLYKALGTGSPSASTALLGDGSWGSISSFWTAMPGTPVRVSNTTFTVTGDYSSATTYPFGKGMIIKWTESNTVRCAMVSIPPTYSAPNTTFTIVGDTMASIDASSLKYAMIGVEVFVWKFAVAGTIGATGTDVANAHYAEEPMRVIAADIQVGTAGTTNNTTVDINKGGTTMFTTKPTLATTVASSPTPFTADSATSLALGDKVTIDQDAIQTTAAIDEYITLYVFPVRYLYLT